VAVAASFALSLAVVGLAFAVAFAVNASIVLAGSVLVFVALAAGVAAALRGEARTVPRSEHRALAGVLAAAVPVAAAVWWAAGPFVGDTYFHVARVRKLAELETLNTLSAVNEFDDGGLHPGYAFPLLHGANALIARLAGIDAADVVIYLPAVLVLLALVLAYGAGSAVFRSSAGGLVFATVQVAHVGFSRRAELFEGTGLFETLSQPQAAGHVLLGPAIIALAFTFVVEGGWVVLASLAASAFALSAVHPTYSPYVALVFGGFILARVVFLHGWDHSLTRAAAALGAIVVPFGLLLLLLLPVARETRAVTPSAGDRAAELDRYANTFTTLGDWFGYSPSAVARAGPVVVAGLLAMPLAAFAARRLWAALVLGGSLAVLAVLLAPPLFTALSDAVSVSQSRRLAGFLPVAFAVAGGCIVLSRLRALGVVVAAGTGVALVLLYPGVFTRSSESGPEWAVAVGVVVGVLALIAGAVRRPRGPDPGVWALLTAAALAAPVVIAGVLLLERDRPLTPLSPELIESVQAQAASRDVVFSDPETAFAVAAFAPVYINAGPIGNVTDTMANRPRIRQADARRFFYRRESTDAERLAILRRYGADWVIVDKEKRYPQDFVRTLELGFEDDRYALYRVGG
jgi:hypothetical protein